jgi:hypothetical protein
VLRASARWCGGPRARVTSALGLSLGLSLLPIPLYALVELIQKVSTISLVMIKELLFLLPLLASLACTRSRVSNRK